jgi:hypothetical protein
MRLLPISQRPRVPDIVSVVRSKSKYLQAYHYQGAVFTHGRGRAQSLLRVTRGANVTGAGHFYAGGEGSVDMAWDWSRPRP